MNENDLGKVRVALSLVEELATKANDELERGEGPSEPLWVEGLRVDLRYIKDDLYATNNLLAHLELYIGRLVGTYDEEGELMSS